MKTGSKNILLKFTKKWQLLLMLKTALYAISLSIMAYLLSLSLWAAFIVFIASIIIGLAILKPWLTTIDQTSRFVDSHLEAVEYSSSLLLQPESQLTNVARLQRFKIEQLIKPQIKKLKPPIKLQSSLVIALVALIVGYLGAAYNVRSYFMKPTPKGTAIERVLFQAVDSITPDYEPPTIQSQNIRIRYPSYTNLRSIKTDNMHIKAVEGSRIMWSLSFNKQVKEAGLESLGTIRNMQLNKSVYTASTVLKRSGFYNFTFTDSLNQKFTSELYAIEVTQDQDPKIKILGLEQYSSFDDTDKKKLNFSTEINDDYGLSDAYIVATVSKGSGESVKFREEKLRFNSSFSKGKRGVILAKNLDLDKLKMVPGDELYFYVEAIDLKQPVPNIARSDTYFAVIKDTLSVQFGVEATLGVDRMPDYFRSQRQLIIDTKKLIAEKTALRRYDFKFKSNELGFDQKALRLKYSAFMGEETANVDLIDEENLEVLESEQGQNSENENDPLAAFTHDHDGDNEHNLVDEKQKNDGEKEKDPLEAFMHDHEDPESATLFEDSLRAKLLKALQQMWDSELQLRLYQPEKSLPHQYKALKYLQEIKNSARIYVHRIGFDPPPIKEENRLTGKLKGVHSFSKQDVIAIKDSSKFMRQAIARLEELASTSSNLTTADQFLFEQAGGELAEIAVEQPGKHLQTLQQLKKLSIFGEKPMELFRVIQHGLIKALPDTKSNPHKTSGFQDELNKLLLNEFEVNEQ